MDKRQLKKVHDRAITAFRSVQSALRDERKQCLQDRRFATISGAQWEGELGDQFANKPKFEVNKIQLAVTRIINEYRNNRITVDFISKDGTPDDKLADACDGLYRADEQDSVAEEAYDNAFDEAVTGGFGAWRLRTKYEDEEDDDDDRQRICIEPIFDADSSVFFDLDSKRQDKSDAKQCWVITAIPKETYIEEYKDDPASWPKDVQSTEFDWFTPSVVYIAEYYEVESTPETVGIYSGLDKQEERVIEDDSDETEEYVAELLATGFTRVGEKKVKRRRVHKYLMSGGGILEDCGYIAGRHIPVIPVYGKRWFIDNVERCSGHVRFAKDAQRIKNMQLSKLGEISALSSVEKPILTPEQVAGHTTMWAEDNIKDYPYLLINPITGPDGNQVIGGPIAYTKPPAIPPALAALLQITEQDMIAILGNQQAGEKMEPNMSGKAVELIQNRLDMQAFIYMSNMAKAIKRCGEVWLGMAREVYVEQGRKMKSVDLYGKTGTIELGRPVIGENGQEYENDLSKALFDVAVDVGPSSSSKRSATVRALTQMSALSGDPETKAVLEASAMMNMDGEGLEDARQFFRKKLVRMGVVKPNDEEAKQLAIEAQNQPPNPQAQYLEAAAKEANAKAVKAVADTELTQAKTVETLAKIDRDDRGQLLETAKAIGGALPSANVNQSGT